jgi:serine/threonine protein kinase
LRLPTFPGYQVLAPLNADRSVFDAVDEDGSPCAIKRPFRGSRDGLVSDTTSDNLDAFRRETEVLTACDGCLNVVQVRGSGLANRQPFLVLERLGHTLESVIGARGMDLVPLFEAVAAVAHGLEEIDGRGYCHYDVKPENVLWDPAHRTWKLIDPSPSDIKTDEYCPRPHLDGPRPDSIALGRLFLQGFLGYVEGALDGASRDALQELPNGKRWVRVLGSMLLDGGANAHRVRLAANAVLRAFPRR